MTRQILKLVREKAFRALKLSSFVVAFLLVTNIGVTSSFLNDTETSGDNFFGAGSLMIDLRSSAGNFYDDPLSLTPGATIFRDVIVQKLGSLDMKYGLEYVFVPGDGSDESLCQNVELTVIHNWYQTPGESNPSGLAVRYQGPLSDFRLNLDGSDPEMVIPNLYPYVPNADYTADEHFYLFQLEFPADAPDSLQDMTCKFDIKATGWQSNFTAPTGGFIDTASLDNQIATGHWSECTAGATWVGEHIESQQGTRKDGSPVTADRRDPLTTLGAADGSFFSLGKDGWIIDKFDQQIADGSGDDISIHEVTYGRESYPEELAKVEVSQDGTTWFYLGQASSRSTDGVSYFDIASTGLSWVQYVRLTDETNFDLHGSTADGFEVDAIDGVYGVCTTLPIDAGMGIVLNEFIPNPIGNDDAVMPEGEWVELFNNSVSPVDVNGWVLYDSDDAHEVIISALNSDNNGNHLDGGETIVPAGGKLVVYRNGDGDFELNNTGDSVRLYDGDIFGAGVLIDSYSYTSTSEGKSFARIPDGVGSWIDPVPTPGGSNINDVSELDPVVKVWQQDGENLQLGLLDVLNYDHAQVSVTYMRDNEGSDVAEGFVKNQVVDRNNIYLQDLFMGTVSGENEYLHLGINSVQVEVMLTGGGLPDRTINVNYLNDWIYD